MGLLDQVLGGILGNALGGGQQEPQRQGGTLTALLPIVLAMLANRQGGAAQAAPGSAGGLGDILGGLLGGGASAGAAGGAGGMGGLGGLGGLLEQMQRAGFGEQAQSWVSTGQNQPVSPDAIGQIFGGGALAQIARQAGVSETEASAGLSQLLPEVVDRLTPDGQVPDMDQLVASVASLQQRLGG